MYKLATYQIYCLHMQHVLFTFLVHLLYVCDTNFLTYLLSGLLCDAVHVIVR